MSSTPPGRSGAEPPHNVAAAIAEVSERASQLVREEIELAKAEVSEKATKLIKGAIVGVAAGIFFMVALLFALVGCAWLLYYFLPVNNFAYFWGFFAMAVILVILGVLAGLVAARAVKKGSPPVPTMAFEEARKIRETVSAPGAGKASADAAFAPGPAFASPTVEDSALAVAESPPSAPAAPVAGEGDSAAVEPVADSEPTEEASAEATVVHESVPAPEGED